MEQMAETNSYSRGPHPSQRRYPPELRERAVRMVQQNIQESGERFGVITKVARQLGIGTESLRSWVRQAEIDGDQRPGVTTQDKERIAALEREVRELRRAMRSCGPRRLSSGQCEHEDCPAGFARFFAALAVAGGVSSDVRPRRAFGPAARVA
jgi:transposase